MGFLAYWPLANISELPYKTTLLSGRWNVGEGGMRLFALAWLLAALGFIAAGLALAFGRPAWAPLLLATAVFSLLLCILDWSAAFRGVWIDIALLLLLVPVFGLRVKPAPFPPFTGQANPPEMVPLPSGLPAPVERYYRQVYGDQVPRITSAVMTGRGTLRFMGVTLPARLRFSHIAGQDYRHYIEATFFGFPVFKVDETYLDGHSRLNLPFGVVENDPGVDSAANQGLWAESLAFPAIFITDPRLRWEARDAYSAALYVPFAGGEQVFRLDFDPHTGAITRLETDRYRDEKAGVLRWWGELLPTSDPSRPKFTVTWEDEGTPWLVYTLEDSLFNADLSAYIHQTGP
jgi:hypothetical protein